MRDQQSPASAGFQQMREELLRMGFPEQFYRSRRTMLLIAFTIFALTVGGIELADADLFGLKIHSGQFPLLLRLAALIAIYEVVSFGFVGWTEYRAWANRVQLAKVYSRILAGEATIAHEGATERLNNEEELRSDPVFGDLVRSLERFLKDPDSRVFLDPIRRRLWFEYWVPLIIAGVATVWASASLLIEAVS